MLKSFLGPAERGCRLALAIVTILACAHSALAQSTGEPVDNSAHDAMLEEVVVTPADLLDVMDTYEAAKARGAVDDSANIEDDERQQRNWVVYRVSFSAAVTAVASICGLDRQKLARLALDRMPPRSSLSVAEFVAEVARLHMGCSR